MRRGLKDVCYRGNFDDPNGEACLQGQRLLFLHIPKNAGTTIEQAARKAGVGWGKLMDWAGCDLGANDCGSPQWHIPPALMNDVNVYSNATVFCVVRNPFARAVSEYKYTLEHLWYVNHFYACSARGLNEWLDLVLRKFLGGDFGIQGCHLVPQSYYIWGSPDSRGEQCQYCHEVLRLEEFPHNFNSLMERHKYSVRLPHKPLNVAAKCDVSVKDLNATTIRLLQSVYKDDFKMLQYPTVLPP